MNKKCKIERIKKLIIETINSFNNVQIIKLKDKRKK